MRCLADKADSVHILAPKDFTLERGIFRLKDNVIIEQPDALERGLILIHKHRSNVTAVDLTPGLDADNGFAVQTELRYWDGTGYETYGWDSEGDPSVPDSDHKWVDEDLAVASRTIELGKGFWIKTPVAGTVTISK